MKSKIAYEISPDYSGFELSKPFKKANRIHIPEFLNKKSAKILFDEICTINDWLKSVGGDKSNYDLDFSALDKSDLASKAKIDTAIYEDAKYNFQYRFDTYRLSDKVKNGECNYPALEAFYNFLNSPKFLSFFRNLIGEKDGVYCDAQVTRYKAGDFLKMHTDLHEEKGRLAAFVFNFTPKWQADWGGLLQFMDADGHISEAYKPCFNALNVFKVPQDHSVSFVTPFADGARISITGWLRRNKD